MLSPSLYQCQPVVGGTRADGAEFRRLAQHWCVTIAATHVLRGGRSHDRHSRAFARAHHAKRVG